MQTPRCGVSDYNKLYRINKNKWNKKVLNWNFYGANYLELDIAKRAFDIWSQYTNLHYDDIHAI